MQLVKAGDESTQQNMPPALLAVLPVIVQLTNVGDASLAQNTAPPLLFVAVLLARTQSMNVGDAPLQQNTAPALRPAVFPVMMQLVTNGKDAAWNQAPPADVAALLPSMAHPVIVGVPAPQRIPLATFPKLPVIRQFATALLASSPSQVSPPPQFIGHAVPSAFPPVIVNPSNVASVISSISTTWYELSLMSPATPISPLSTVSLARQSRSSRAASVPANPP